MYTGFAEVYDTLMNDVHYGAWADMYARMMTAYGIPRNAKVCECACGTGSLTLPLQQLGYEMMGIDLSQEMLWQAAQKARKAGFGIPFIRQDMRQLRLHRPVDAVLATCDGVNYLLQDVDAAAFFQSSLQAQFFQFQVQSTSSSRFLQEKVSGVHSLQHSAPQAGCTWYFISCSS